MKLPCIHTCTLITLQANYNLLTSKGYMKYQVDITPTWSTNTTEQFHVTIKSHRSTLGQCAIHIHQTERVGTVLSVTAYVHETVPMFVVCTCTLLVSIHHLLQLSRFASTCSLY